MHFIYSWSWDENYSVLNNEAVSHSYAQNIVYGQKGTIPFIYVYIKSKIVSVIEILTV